jgi:hypothetical protein
MGKLHTESGGRWPEMDLPEPQKPPVSWQPFWPIAARHWYGSGLRSAGASNTRNVMPRQSWVPSWRRTMLTVRWNTLRASHNLPSSVMLGSPAVNQRVEIAPARSLRPP